MSTDPFQTPDPGAEPQPTPRPLAPGDRLGAYTLLKVVGTGWAGTVYQGHDTRLDRLVAIKVFQPQFVEQSRLRERFLRDMRATATVRHDNVVAIYSVEEIDGLLVVVMEWLTGQSLGNFLLKGDVLGPLQIARIGREIARGLKAIHEQGLVHRGIKPANIWLTAPEGTVKVLDPAWFNPGNLGTPGLMSPEQMAGKPVDHRSDLFSLGVLLYRLCSGRLPFDGESTWAILAAVHHHTPPPPSAYNPEVQREMNVIVMRLLAKDPAARPASAEEVSVALSRLREASSAGSEDTGETTPSLPRARTPRMAADSDSEFELALDDNSGVTDNLAQELAGEADSDEDKRDIFETDFELPAVSDDAESGSEVVAIEGSDTDPENSDFDLALNDYDDDADLDDEDMHDDDLDDEDMHDDDLDAPDDEDMHDDDLDIPDDEEPSTPLPPSSRPRLKSRLNPLNWFRRPADPVDVTAFAPPTVVARNAVMVQLFAHVPEKATEAKKLATLFDSTAGPRGVTSLELDVRRGTALTIHLAAGPLAVDEPWQRLVWRGKTAAVQFAVSAADTLPPQTVVATAQVFQDAIPVGTVRFKLDVTTTPAGPPAVTGRGTRYRTAFVSYATPDRAEVLKRVQALRAVRVEVFQDILALEPGERWERKLYERIDACDLFLLFWSVAATQSEWVRKELRYAVGRKNGSDESPPDIVPVVLDGPPPPDPPSELRHLHFDDYLAHLIRGAG